MPISNPQPPSAPVSPSHSPAASVAAFNKTSRSAAELMRYLAAVPLMLLAVGSTSAAMAPEVYEAARVDAADVIVIAIADATPPPGADYGKCTVTGIVHVVERGARYTTGDPVSLAVDCARPGADYPDGGALYEELETLLRSTYGRVWLGPDGTIVLSQYQQLTEAELP